MHVHVYFISFIFYVYNPALLLQNQIGLIKLPLSPEVDRDKSRVVAKLVCPASTRMTRSISPFPI